LARPQKRTVDYFPHDSHASEGDTLTVLQNRFGNDGYAFWFKLLERLASSEGHYLDCSNPVKWQVFLAKMRVNELLGVEIMNLLVEIKAIDKDLWGSRLIWCQNLVDNVADVYKNRRREIPQKPITTTLNGITTDDNPLTTGESTQSKLNYSKLNKTILYKHPYGEFKNVLLTDGEYKKLEDRFNTSLSGMIETLSLGIASKGYKYKSHYAAILSWHRKEEKDGERVQQNRRVPDKYTEPPDSS